jgi:hypothetical protein
VVLSITSAVFNLILCFAVEALKIGLMRRFDIISEIQNARTPKPI